MNQNNSSGWSFTLPLVINNDINHKYNAITKDFLDNYCNACSIGISSLDSYYENNAMFSLQIYQNNNNKLTEIVGFNNFKNKLTELNITSMKLNNYRFTSQPLNNTNILISIHGKININGTDYNSINTFIVKVNDTNKKIVNHIFEIFI